MKVPRLVSGALVALAALALHPDAATGQDQAATSLQGAVGAASRVETSAFRSPSGLAERRDLTVEDPVFAEDLVGTAATGGLRLLFIDGAELTVGPGSEVVLDRFVYDPDATPGLDVTLSRGVLRFASGFLPEDDIAIHTPPATLGIRGTIVEVLTNGFWAIVRVLDGAGEIDGVLASAGQYLYVPFPGAEPQVGTLPVGGFPPLLTQFGLDYPLDELALFLRQGGNRGFVDLAELLALLEQEPLRHLCGRNDSAGSAEADQDSYCGIVQVGGGGNDDEDDPTPPPPPPPPPDDDDDCDGYCF
ncbi:MAG: FecR domain-containing protein [Azospirillaceae bacterium]